MTLLQKIINLRVLRPYFYFKKSLVVYYKKIKTKSLVFDYLEKNEVRKIHLGCGSRIFSGWLNADINIYNDCYIDLTKKLPLPDNSVDFIYSEHVFEHLEYVEGQKLLKECYRILKPNGVIRTVMPDLDFFVEGINKEKIGVDFESYQDFINTKITSFGNLTNLPANMNTILNFACHCCGCGGRHKYLYQDKTFINLLSQCGFNQAKRVELGKSDFAELSNLETSRQGRSDDLRFHLMESMSIEAIK